jgi:Spy/CpxP family protein refolding chaperone
MKTIFLMILLLVGTGVHAQSSPAFQDRMQRWRELNLTQKQKEQISLIIKRQRMQQYLDWAELNRILTKDQKKKLRGWKEKANKKPN